MGIFLWYWAIPYSICLRETTLGGLGFRVKSWLVAGPLNPKPYFGVLNHSGSGLSVDPSQKNPSFQLKSLAWFWSKTWSPAIVIIVLRVKVIILIIIEIVVSNSNNSNHSNTNKSPIASRSRYSAWKGQGHGKVRISVVERGGEHGHDLVVSNEV